MHDSDSGIGIREVGLGIGTGVRNFKSGHILILRFFDLAAFGAGIKVLGLENGIESMDFWLELESEPESDF